MLHSLDRVLHTEADQLRVHSDLLEELADDFLLVHELDIGERVLSETNGLVEALVHTVAHIDCRDDLFSDANVEMITLLEDKLKIGATSDHNTAAITPVIGDELLLGHLTTFDDVGVTLLLSETGETNS